MVKTRRFTAWIGAALLAIPAVAATDERSAIVPETALENKIRQDVEDLHDFFVGWYNGTLPESAFETEFAARLDPAFTIIMPNGVELDHDALSFAMRDSFGKNPGFRIEIRKLRLVHASEATAVATYEEWQYLGPDEADYTSARISSVVFSRSDRLKWLHVQETWLPEEIIIENP
jgi:hypothetical protein